MRLEYSNKTSLFEAKIFQRLPENFLCTRRTCPKNLKGEPNLVICVSKKNQSHITKTSDGNQKVKGRENPRFFPLPGPHATIQSKMMRIVFDKKKISNEHARPSEHFSNSYTVPKGNPYVR